MEKAKSLQSELARVSWHSRSVEDALAELESGGQGLAESEARQRIERYGRNLLEVEEGGSPFRLLLKQFANPMIYLLAVAAGVSVATGHVIDAAVIVVVILLNTLVGFFQEYRAERALEALRGMTTPRARVLREGRVLSVEAAEVVPGDHLVLETGDAVAADARLLEVRDLEVDESVLTGESEPVAKDIRPLPEGTALADRKNMVWMTTAVTAGRAHALVVGTGMNTELGRIAGAVHTTRREETPLQRSMSRLSVLLGGIGVGFAFLVFLLGLLRGYELLDMVLYGVAVAVSAIPEGLPAVISVTLALGVQRMARRHAIIRRLPAVETLGSTTVICSDKTGTITRNEMTVVRMWAGGREYEVSGVGYGLEGSVHPAAPPDAQDVAAGPDEAALRNGQESPDLWLLSEIGRVANNASLRRDGGRIILEGSPTEKALLVASHKTGIDTAQPAGRRLAEIPFASRTKYMAVLAGSKIYVKGAPERILSFCTHVMTGGRRTEMTGEHRRRIEEVNERLAGQALRVVAGAWKEAEPGQKGLQAGDVEQGLTFVGLWGLLDPPREESVQAIAEAKGAGVHIVMITGDHATTASAIARRTGIAAEGVQAVTGAEMEAMDPEATARAAMETAVFARVTPSHKLQILEALKRKNQIVAMTGDGVNDAPALKGADIGIAMGQSGTEVAKSAADMILTDDNFATIVHAVEEGRVIFNNIQRVIFFLLATNLGEIFTLAAALLLGLPLPLTAVMILWVNLVTDGVSTVPLGMEPSHRDVLESPPRRPGSAVLDRRLIIRLLLVSLLMTAGTVGLFTYELRTGSVIHARTIAFTTLAAFQWFQAFNARSRRYSVFGIGVAANRWLLLGVGLAVVLQVLALHTAFGNTVFGTVPLDLTDWALIVAVSASVWVVDEILKLFGTWAPRVGR